VRARIVIVEDEPDLRDAVAEYLGANGYDVTQAGSAAEARTLLETESFNLAILDIAMPGEDGLSLGRWLRSKMPIGIIYATAAGTALDRIVGLELGADDYIVKPFSPKELVARVRAVLRRTAGGGALGSREVLRAGGVEVDLPRMRVTVKGRRVELTPTEFDLLATLVREPGRVFTRGQLLDAIRGVAFESYERAVDAHVKNLRKKIEQAPGAPRYILTVHGIGYRFADA